MSRHSLLYYLQYKRKWVKQLTQTFKSQIQFWNAVQSDHNFSNHNKVLFMHQLLKLSKHQVTDLFLLTVFYLQVLEKPLRYFNWSLIIKILGVENVHQSVTQLFLITEVCALLDPGFIRAVWCGSVARVSCSLLPSSVFLFNPSLLKSNGLA